MVWMDKRERPTGASASHPCAAPRSEKEACVEGAAAIGRERRRANGGGAGAGLGRAARPMGVAGAPEADAAAAAAAMPECPAAPGG